MFLCVSSVVHEMNGEDGIHLLSSSEVEELLQQAEKASSRSPTGATLTAFPAEEVQEVYNEVQAVQEEPELADINGLQLEVGGASGPIKGSPTHPVTMVFMGFQNVDDEDQTRKVLGLQGTVKAQLVHIHDTETTALAEQRGAEPPAVTTPAPPPSNGSSAEWAGPEADAAAQVKKDKQPCRCCSIM